VVAMTLAVERNATPQDLLESRGRGRFELVDGQLVEKPAMAKASNDVAGEIMFLIRQFLRSKPIAKAYPEQEFMCFGRSDDPTRVRKPDVAVVLLSKVAADASDESFFRVPPDIAIEVTSPNDRATERSKKLRDYERAGVPLVWIVDPELHEVEIRRANGPINTLRESDTLTAEPILPGFGVKVADLFPPVAKPT
jgi:Uma2 family endonuclease